MGQEKLTIKVDKVELAEGDSGPYKRVKFTDGRNFTCFQNSKQGPTPGYDLIVPNAVLDITARISERHKNIIDAKVHEGPWEESQQKGNGPSPNGDEKRESIEAQQALINATAMGVARIGQGEDYTDERILLTAAKFRDFLAGNSRQEKPDLRTASDIVAEAPVEDPKPPAPLTETRFIEIAKFLGFPDGASRNKALGVAKGADWTAGKEAAMDKLLEKAHLEGRHQQYESWKQIG